MSDDLTTRLAQVLGEHRLGCTLPYAPIVLVDYTVHTGQFCTCKGWVPENPGNSHIEHRAHVAAALATEVAAWLESDEALAAHRDAYAGGRHLGVCLSAVADLARGGE